ncbi:hypothetical protein D0Z00_002827 [Geotrichum galactomycetum]|uniref:Uncharacterized protein n=1 Tax=Geotrichum galactomycetum TaxID=27317 RepID=A0ACB6V333_9ASCO|nr:hypothetical protein D0Z00_002827 [Geotrichum candidum]
MNAANSLDLKIPANGHPTEVLAARFASWRKIIRALNVYFKEYASVQDEVVRHNVRLGHAVSFPFFQFGTADSSAAAAAAVAASAAAQSSNDYPIEAAASISSEQPQSSPFHLHAPNMHPEDDQTRKMFLPFGSTSIADVPGNIIAFHRAQAATASRTSKELNNNIIPRLEDLRRDLLVKIKEIKNLSSDFKNAVQKEQASTHKELAAYINACEVLNANPALLVPKHDPFLLKYTLNKQITRQVNEENYLLEAFLNIQTSGKELERVVVQEIQQALNVFGRLTGIAAQNIQDLLSNKILGGFVSKEATAEWENFIAHDPNFVDPNTKLRNVNELEYTNMHSSLAHDIRSGYLERRSKYLKSYSKAWYVLTPSFLHEFKSNDRRRDPFPVMSLSLNDCQVTYDKKSRSDSHKFILNAHQSGSSGISGKGHNWVFRAESKEKLEEWFQDLSILSQITSPVERAKKYFPSQSPVEKKVAPQERQAPPSQADLTAVVSSPTFPQTPVRVNGGFNIDESIDPLTPSRSYAEQRPRSTLVTSPVFSDTSEVTSTGEPYAGSVINEDYKLPSPNPEYVEETRRPGPRGRFPSEVNLNKYMVDAASNASVPPTPFIIPGDQTKMQQQDDEESSVFSYDLKKETHSTLPSDGTIPSKLKATNGNDDAGNMSVVSNKSGPQRYNSLSKATGSYGVENVPDGYNAVQYN